MSLRAQGVKSLTAASFKAFGRMIEYPSKEQKGLKRNLWRIVHTSVAKTGWRIAYLVLRDKTCGRLEMHPGSDETFEPIKGRALFFVAKNKRLEDVECFLLDRPIVLFKGVWHGLIALDPEAEIKIVENSQVTCRYWSFGFRIKRMADLCK
ncbi:hypothetical protein ACFL49_02560 [Candidatus Omnitrophota bacterium]